VFRRILLLLNVWDGSTLREQQDTFGRNKISGAPYGTTHEFDPVDLSKIPRLSHIKLANPRNGDQSEKERILRRGYNYHHGYKATGGLYDCGLAFLAYQRDPRKQFVPIQKRLAPHDELNRYLIHTASGLFAVPPGTKPGGYVGETLLES
jgi:deferrochelatase/peroxidase EfeB